MWGFLVLLLGMVFHPRSGKRSGKSRAHRKFYRQGLMTEELEALRLEERNQRRHRK